MTREQAIDLAVRRRTTPKGREVMLFMDHYGLRFNVPECCPFRPIIAEFKRIVAA